MFSILSAMRRGALVCSIVLSVPAAIDAQDGPVYDGLRTEPVRITRIDGGVQLDGLVDEPLWDDIQPLPMTMYSPVFGGQMTERTEVRLAHDDEYLYMSGRLFDSEPDKVRINSLYRDRYSGDDLLALVVDSYNDFETAVWFITTPAGIRNDRAVSNDAEFSGGGGGGAMNTDWNAHWEVVSQVDGDGWSTEFRIPFSTLGFQSVDGDVTMGVIAYRFVSRKNERQIYPAIEPRWGRLGFAKPSQAQRVSLSGIQRSKPVYVTPFWLGGLTQSPVLAEPPAVPYERWRTHDVPTREVGLDLRYSPTSNLTVDLTANTDFAQVEADDQQVNLTRFPLFFPEKRQFFQERSSTFDFGAGGRDRLFHSRRIGLESGEIVRIYGGARLVGRWGGMDFGLLNMQTAAQGDRSGENMGVLRINQQVLNPYSSIGAMVTSRIGSDGEDNVGFGVDALIRPFGDEYLTAKWVRTFDELVDEGGTLDASLALVRWERRRDEGFNYYAEGRRVGPDYLPRMGFQQRTDFLYYGTNAQYRRFLGAASALESVEGGVTTSGYFRPGDRTAESREVRPSVNFSFRNGLNLTVNATSEFESLDDGFSISDATIPAGEYWFHGANVRLDLPRSWPVRGMYNAAAGQFYDGTRVGLEASPTWTASEHLEITTGYEINRITFGGRDESTITHVARLKFDLALDARLSLSAFSQYSNVADLTSLNLRFRYHFREGTDLWIVWNEGLNMERGNGLDPRRPLSAGRSVMVKYSHALIW